MGAYDKIKRGKAPDLGDIHFRSSWERNIARILNWRVAKGELLAWEYEPFVFTFPGVLRGAVCYLPDFKLLHVDGSIEWLEVKGWETSKDRTKFKRMAKHYPHVKLTVMRAPDYKALQSKFGGLPHWEH